MRTTVIIDEGLGGKLKGLASKRALSDFINRCLREHFERQEKLHLEARLAKAYARAAGKKKGLDEFDAVNREEWPEW